MLSDTLKYPARGSRAARTLLAGSILSSFWLLVLPVIPVFGYCVRVLRASLAGREHPPVFDEPVALTKDGSVALGVLLAYLSVPVIAFAGVVLVSGGVGLQTPEQDLTFTSVLAGALVGFLALGFLALVSSYIGVAAVTNYARVGSVRAAFDVRTILSVTTSAEYLKGWIVGIAGVIIGAIVAVAAGFVLGVVFGVLGLIPLIGVLLWLFGLVLQWVLACFLGFYFLVGNARATALGFRSALEA